MLMRVVYAIEVNCKLSYAVVKRRKNTPFCFHALLREKNDLNENFRQYSWRSANSKRLKMTFTLTFFANCSVDRTSVKVMLQQWDLSLKIDKSLTKCLWVNKKYEVKRFFVTEDSVLVG